MDDPLVIEMPGEKPREPLDLPGVREPATAPLGRRPVGRVGQGTDHLVLQGAIVHRAARMRSTLEKRTSAVSDGENASNVTAFAAGQRVSACAMKSSITSLGAVGAIHGPSRSPSCSTPATCTSTTCSKGNSASHAWGVRPL